MTSVRGRLGAFALILAGLLATSYAVGARLKGDDAAAHDHADMQHADHGGAISGKGATIDGVTLNVLSSPVETPGEIAVRFTAADGSVITDFEDNHGALVHMLVIRSDLQGFQHVHPAMDASGVWSVPLALDTPGAYRVVTDVLPAGADAAVSPAVDVVVPGLGPREPLPPADDDVSAAHGLRIARSDFAFTVSPSEQLEPYLGQPAHLVGFREADRAYLHLHAESGDGGVFRFADPPSDASGRWRFFLQFGHAGDVVTQAFTVEL